MLSHRLCHAPIMSTVLSQEKCFENNGCSQIIRQDEPHELPPTMTKTQHSHTHTHICTHTCTHVHMHAHSRMLSIKFQRKQNMERNTSLLPKKKKRKTRSKHFERVLFYSLKIIHPAETFPGMCDPSSKNSEFLKVVPGLCPWALGYSKPSALNLCCSSS